MTTQKKTVEEELKELSHQLSCDRHGDGISATYRFGQTPFVEKMRAFVEAQISSAVAAREAELRERIEGMKPNQWDMTQLATGMRSAFERVLALLPEDKSTV